MHAPLYDIDLSLVPVAADANTWIPAIEDLQVGKPCAFDASRPNTLEDLMLMHGRIFQLVFSLNERAIPKNVNMRLDGDVPLLMHLCNCLQHLALNGVGILMDQAREGMSEERASEISRDRSAYAFAVHGIASSMLRHSHPEIYSRVAQMYLDAGFFGVDDIFTRGPDYNIPGASSFRLLEKCVVERNAELAVLLVENGATLELVPAHTAGHSNYAADPISHLPGYTTVAAGDFVGFVETICGRASPQELAIKAAVMNRGIERQLRGGTPVGAEATRPVDRRRGL